MRIRRRFAVLLALFVLCTGFFVASVSAQTVTAFAAASLAEALAEILRRYEPGASGKVVTSFAASSALARQIERGAPADVFISADQAWMDYLAQRGLIDRSTRGVVAGNRLVLIAPRGSPLEIDIGPGMPLAKILGDSRLAMGDPAHVPAGRYGQAALTALGLWSTVASRIAAAENVRAAVNYVARGESVLGIVYATDAARAAVRVVGIFPAGLHPAIEYPGAVVASTRHPAAARALLGHLRSTEAAAIFRQHGFTTAH